MGAAADRLWTCGHVDNASALPTGSTARNSRHRRLRPHQFEARKPAFPRSSVTPGPELSAKRPQIPPRRRRIILADQDHGGPCALRRWNGWDRSLPEISEGASGVHRANRTNDHDRSSFPDAQLRIFGREESDKIDAPRQILRWASKPGNHNPCIRDGLLRGSICILAFQTNSRSIWIPGPRPMIN
jgi:hypothetical protein